MVALWAVACYVQCVVIRSADDLGEGVATNQTRNDASGTAETVVQAGSVNAVHIHVADRARQPAETDAKEPRRGVGEAFADTVAGGGKRRLRKLSERLAESFAARAPSGDRLDQAARNYHDALRLAFRIDPPAAVELHQAYDARFPAGHYPLRADDQGWLAVAISRPHRDVLGMVLDIASRLDLPELRRAARDQLTIILSEATDASLLISHLRHWNELAILDGEALSRALDIYARRAPLVRDEHVWRPFLEELPAALVPDRFDVHYLLGHGADTVRLAQQPAQKRMALECCLSARRVEDAQAGLALARREPEHAETIIAHARHVGDVLFEAGEYAKALDEYQGDGAWPERASVCHELLGEFFDAVDVCPLTDLDRLVRLVARCTLEIDSRVERQEFTTAAEKLRGVRTRLGQAEPETDALTACRDDLDQRLRVLIDGARYAFRRKAAAHDEPAAIYTEWSRFEKAAGEPAFAARRAEDAGDLYRAHYLFKEAGLFGEATRVLKGDDSREGTLARASAYEEGGDLLGAARLFEQCSEGDRAADLYINAEDFAAAAHCLMEHKGDDKAIEDPRTADCLIRMRDYESLLRLSEQGVRAMGPGSLGVQQIRLLAAQGLVPPHRKARVGTLLESLDEGDRRRFEERAQAWVVQARAETNRRFAGTWGMDLGTSTCVTAVYDTRDSKPVICPWKGSPLLPATISLDRAGNELIGIIGEESLAPGIIGRIVDAKRRMGRRIAFKIRDRTYRPEEAAARLISHAREQVENYLRGQVRERVRELAESELGEVREEWLAWAEENHDLRLTRLRAVITIPAYFRNNQKHATRIAGKIAGIKIARLIHEPTAACIEAARQRSLTGRVLVVDLGAGTLDFSLLNVRDGVYEVEAVGGDAGFGSRDFDPLILCAIRAQLRERGIAVLAGDSARRRLEVAAERLKTDLSAQSHAQYTLRGLADGGGDVTVELDRPQLSGILREPLARLRQASEAFKQASEFNLAEGPRRLVLIGGPMLSPMIREAIEESFGLHATDVRDPRLAVACGAAIQGAVLDGKCADLLLLDVTPLSLGIQARGADDKLEYSEIIASHTTIPAKHSKMFTTTRDNQTEVDIVIFNGSLDTEAKIGKFILSGIPPVAKGQPQIEVTFNIDASCVLEVTARDLGTGRSETVRIEDTTLLSPGEAARLAQRFQEQQQRDDLRRQAHAKLRLAADRIASLEIAATDCEAAWNEFRQRKAVFRAGAAPLDDMTQRALAELFSSEHELAADLNAVLRPIPDALRAGRESLSGAGTTEPAGLAEITGLVDRLGVQADLVAELMTKLAAWNAALITAAMANTDPIYLFRSHHDAGDYLAAVAALDRIQGPIDDVRDIRRQLRCLAEVGDTERYRAVLAANARQLGALPVTLPIVPSGEAELADLVRRSLVRVHATRVDGSEVTGSGFLAGESVVLTCGSWLTDPSGKVVAASSVQVTGAGTATWTASVAEFRVTGQEADDVAALRLARAAGPGPLRLGFSALTRVGDTGWTIAPAPGGGDADQPSGVTSGLIEKFLPSPESGIGMFKVAMDLGGIPVGGPLLNEFGEVVGVITHGEGDTGATVSAAMVDSVSDLLTAVGVER